MSLSLFWLIVFLVMIFVDVITINLSIIWFVVGALAALILSIFVDSLLIQIFLFIIVCILTKPLINRFHFFENAPTDFDRVLGRNGIVCKRIGIDNYGEVKVLGGIWTACSSTSEIINAGEKVVVLGIEGVKLIVKKENE